ncbi:MAG: hypothetical protein AB7E47_09315 [Desulfovibrionaceae bacterium]
MAPEKFEIKATCPSCGCACACSLSEMELRDRTGGGDFIELTCDACKAKYEAPIRAVCLEWDEICVQEASRLG